MKTKQILYFFAMFYLCITSCSSNNMEWKKMRGGVWNTLFTIKYESKQNLEDSVYHVFEIIENSLSVFNKESLINKVNMNDSSEIDSYFREVFETSKKISIISEGRFDPTVGKLVDLWGFGLRKKENRLNEPDSKDINQELENVGIACCKIENNLLIKKNLHTTFNFSAIAKGYCCDLIAKMFVRNGVENYMIEIGGEIALGGYNNKGGDWVIQIDAPRFEENFAHIHESFAKIKSTDCGIATSGNYRNNRNSESGTLGHIINPITGYPYDNDILSVTIIAENTMTADAIATACMVMNIFDARNMISGIEGVEALFIIKNGTDGYKAITTEQFPPLID